MPGLALGLYLGSGRAGGGTPVPPVEKPTVLTAPTITLDGYTATITLGAFSGADSTAHELLVDGVSVGPISAGTHDVSEYAGSTLVVRSTGTNAAGSTSSDSDPVEMLPILYSATFGDGTDKNGRAILPLNPAAKRIWVNSVSGSDANDGLSAGQPLKTLNAARLKITNNAGDQVMLTGTFSEWIGDVRSCKGASARYPTVWQCYDPADPSNEDKYGAAAYRAIIGTGQGGVSNSFIGNSTQGHNIALRGVEYKPPQVPDNIFSFGSDARQNTLIESCIFHHTAFNIQSTAEGMATNQVMRHTSIYGGFTIGSGHQGGMFIHGNDGFAFEGAISINAGIPMGPNYSRDTIRPKAWTVAAATTGTTIAVLSATGIATGQQVMIDGIVAGVTVAGVSGTTITLSGPVTIPSDNTPVQFYIGATCTTTASSTTVSVGSTTGLAVNQYVSGPGIPAGATIKTVGAGTITISSAATASASGILVAGIMPMGDIFTHNMYFSTDNDNVVIDGCLFARPNSHAVQLRGGGEIARSVMIACPIPLLTGGGTSYGRTYPGDPDSPILYSVTSATPTGGIIVNGVTLTFGTDIATGATASATAANIAAALTASTDPAISKIKDGSAVAGKSPGFNASGSIVSFWYDTVANADAELVIALVAGTTGITATLKDAPLSPDPDQSPTLGHRPNGVLADAHHLLVLGSDNIHAAAVRHAGIEATNTKSGTKIRQNLLVDSQDGASQFIVASSQRNQPSIAEGYLNQAYNWGNAGGVTGIDNFPARNDLTLHDNIISTDPSPYNLAIGLAAQGFDDLDAYLDHVVRHPEQPWAARWLQPAFAAAEMSFQDM